jgi:hypothetical protein
MVEGEPASSREFIDNQLSSLGRLTMIIRIIALLVGIVLTGCNGAPLTGGCWTLDAGPDADASADAEVCAY